MKGDLDRLMAERKLDAAVIMGPDGLGPVNAHFNYFVGGRHLVGYVIKRRGEPATLIHGTMERDAAAETGLRLRNFAEWPVKEIRGKAENPFEADAEILRRILTDLGVGGRVGFYGVQHVGYGFALMNRLRELIPGLVPVGEGNRDLIQVARETKDADEIAAMEEAGRRTCALVGDVREWLRGHKVRDETLVSADGSPLTIGDVRRFIGGRLIHHGLEHPGEVIFSLGRDAGVPHNHGNDKDAVRLGRSIIFDIFPRVPGGYFHDMTRTWCLGYAPKEVEAAWKDVYDVFHHIVGGLKPGANTHRLQLATCEFYEKRGHPTLRQDAKLDHGYIHSLGHGLGLEVHEQPGCPTFNDPGTTFDKGVVLTIEPGLYYPAKGYGVRIEDTYVCDHDGKFRTLTPFPQDLVVPMG
jgi:Xaa-Pro aminopeptidase